MEHKQTKSKDLDIKLTKMAKAAGCAAKISPEILSKVLRNIHKPSDEKLLVGVEHSDDAAVYKINDEIAIIQTLDFFPPIVDNPYDFGQIAAANALSDVYAMGGEPILALNIVCFPGLLEPEILGEIIRGGQDKVEEAGALLVGGHSISDAEPKYGLSVTGLIHPDKVRANSGAKIGDVVLLTKPLGVGVINTAVKMDKAPDDVAKAAIETMKVLNKYAKEACDGLDMVHAITDVTGFSLMGHGIEMAEASSVCLEIDSAKVPYIKGTKELAEEGIKPGGAIRNRNYFEDRVNFSESVPAFLQDICFDPQTSGGLLISVGEEDAEKIIESMASNGLKAYKIGLVKEYKDKYIDLI